MAETKTDQMLRVLVRREGEFFVLQCVDFEISVQSKRYEDLPVELLAALLSTFKAYASEGKSMFRDHPRPPEVFAQIFDALSMPTDFPESITLDGTVVKPEARVLVGGNC